MSHNFSSNNCATTFFGASPIVQFIRNNFMGANISVKLPEGETLTGEVVGSSDNILALKSGATIAFINGNFIIYFI